MSAEDLAPVNEEDLKDLKARMKLIADADASQYHNEFSLRRYLRAFKTTDDAFQALLKTNKWRETYGVAKLSEMDQSKLKNKARVLRHRDCVGRPVIYIPAKNHSSSERDLDELTRFIVYNLEEACKKCFEEVTDRLCIVFDLAEFSTSCMDYQLVQNLIWLLGKHYPERLGVCLIINAPGIFSTIWPAIRILLDDNTAKKVKFVSNEVELCQYLIPDILPIDM
ncbi:CRAL-TRIO domain-containing protein C3H8.02 [Scaptodrosophila lebanonensis]|uniref:CRAL-TRIO domain-containing protein C3H8.02 n=1 Tax=Drosophila lebanonensis TaxID=7225 RepID=A0A6J2UE52_DROLE|nr:CRAL-TRIO domain-containing protein C3H8.02 [Scaptodrosophila lebanonensis]